MTIKYVGDDGEPKASKRLRHSKQNNDHAQEDFDPAIDYIGNGGNGGAMGEEVEESHKRNAANLEKNQRLDYQMHLKAGIK